MSKKSRIKKSKPSADIIKPSYKTEIIGVLTTAGLAAAVAAILYVSQPKSTPPQYTPTASSQLETKVQISFEMARQREELRQPYLDQLFSQRETLGVPGWDSIEGVVYDPDEKKMQAEFERKGMVDHKKIKGYQPNGTSLLRIASTPYFGQTGVKSKTYLTRDAFRLLANEDEILSALDNESAHAQVVHKNTLHISLNTPDRDMSPAMFELGIEVLSFEKQFYYMETGKRKTTKGFADRMKDPARTLYKLLVEKTRIQNEDTDFAVAIVQAIESRPTAKYFR